MRIAKNHEKSKTVELDENYTYADYSQFSALEIEQAMERLKAADRDILFLTGIYGYTVKDILKLINENENTVYKKISRAKARLKACGVGQKRIIIIFKLH